MPLRKSSQAAKRVFQSTAIDGASVVPTFGEFTTTNAASLLLNDVIAMVPFPANTIPVLLRAVIGDIDTGATLTMDFGILSGQDGNDLDDAGAARVCGTEFGAALTTGQAGGAVDVAANLLLGVAPSMRDRTIGFKIAAAAAGVNAGAKVRVVGMFVPAPQGVAIVA